MTPPESASAAPRIFDCSNLARSPGHSTNEPPIMVARPAPSEMTTAYGIFGWSQPMVVLAVLVVLLVLLTAIAARTIVANMT
jgi:hypothetical protein